MNLQIFFYILLCFFVPGYLAISEFGMRLAESDAGFERVELIFSLLTAAIITSMSIIGSNGNAEINWRRMWQLGKKNVSRLTYFILLFYLYIFSLALMVLFEATKCISLSMLIGRALGFLIPFTFLISLPIPFVLFKIKSDQMNQGIKNARK